MAQKPAASVVVELQKEKETKNTVRFAEQGDEQQLGILYIPKTTLQEIGNPEAITVTIEAA